MTAILPSITNRPYMTVECPIAAAAPAKLTHAMADATAMVLQRLRFPNLKL